MDHLHSRFNEVLAGVATVKGFTMEDVEKRRFLSGVHEGIEVVRRGPVRGRTTFVVAHRLSAALEADRIVVLPEGRIVASGTREALMRDDEYYAGLVRRQSRGFLAQAA